MNAYFVRLSLNSGLALSSDPAGPALFRVVTDRIECDVQDDPGVVDSAAARSAKPGSHAAAKSNASGLHSKLTIASPSARI